MTSACVAILFWSHFVRRWNHSLIFLSSKFLPSFPSPKLSRSFSEFDLVAWRALIASWTREWSKVLKSGSSSSRISKVLTYEAQFNEDVHSGPKTWWRSTFAVYHAKEHSFLLSVVLSKVAYVRIKFLSFSSSWDNVVAFTKVSNRECGNNVFTFFFSSFCLQSSLS